MNQNINLIKLKRKKLGWTLKDLADKTNIPYGILSMIERGTTFWMDDYISLIEVTLNRALSFPNKKWSYKYDRCEKCGTTHTKHVSRGLCKNCYDKYIEKRHKDEDRIRKYRGSSSILTKEYLLENYIKNKKSLSDIAKETNCSRQYVYKVLKHYHISPRDKSSAREIALDKGKVIHENVSYEGTQQFITLEKVSLNDSFFSSWSSEMAYVLGIIYTDGCLNPGRKDNSAKKSVGRVFLGQKEPELLEKVLTLMNCDAKIYFTKKRLYNDSVAGELYSFQIYNDKVYNDLERLGLTPKKSLSLKFPEIPEEYIRHFIRGCWDGDGSIYFERGKILRADFVSGSYALIKGMVEKLYISGIHQTIYAVSNEKELKFRSQYPRRQYPLKIYKKKNSNAYYIKISSKEALEKLFAYFYKDVDESMYLNRKYKKLAEGLNIKCSA